MEDMVLEPPRAKKELYWRRREVVVVSVRLRFKVERSEDWISKTRIRGMFVARVCVMRRRVMRSWIVRDVAMTGKISRLVFKARWMGRRKTYDWVSCVPDLR